jgi:hypothetical protein
MSTLSTTTERRTPLNPKINPKNANIHIKSIEDLNRRGQVSLQGTKPSELGSVFFSLPQYIQILECVVLLSKLTVQHTFSIVASMGPYMIPIH